MTNGDDRERLLDLLRALSFERRRVVLSSGKESDFYIDCKRTALTAEGHARIGRLVVERIRRLPGPIHGVGGLTLGADPVATALLHAAASRGQDLDAFVVRKEAKAHGMQRRIEGPDVAGRRVVVVEDTSTTGGSPVTAVQAVREAGGEVVGVATIVDRGTGAREVIEALGVPYHHLLDLSDLGLA